MRLLHITPYYAPAYAFGGVVSAVTGMTQALAARGHRVTILTTDALNRHERFLGSHDEMVSGVRVVRVPNLSVWLRGQLNLSTPWRMGQTAKSLLADIDVIHLHEFRTVENALIIPLAAQTKIPIVLSPHGTLIYATGRSTLKQMWDKVVSPRIAPNIQHVLGLTSQEVQDAQTLWQHFGNLNTAFSVIPNGVNAAEFAQLPTATMFRQQYAIPDENHIMLFMGRLHARKGVEVLVRAFLAAHLPQTTLVLAGPDEGMLPIITPLLNDKIIVTGYLKQQQRLEALAATTLFVLPAVGEGLPMAALEAMAAGIPVLLSPGCNLPEVVPAGAGVMVEPESEPLADALKTLFADKTQLKSMGQNAKNLMMQRFTWDKVAAQLEAVYQECSD
jgi:glycosyltransferase involved in cell wall biosynthesis